MKILVIHPRDFSTDFLKPIYENIEHKLIDYNPSHKELKELIEKHETIYMMGHGDQYGLYGFGRRIITSNQVYLLRKDKNLVSIWCNADQFMKKYELTGIYTGMIISEEEEATYEYILASQK